jgi:hypothetical protein
VRGKLTQKDGQPSVLTTPEGKSVPLEGDDQTTGVLRDARLKDLEFEAIGHYTPNGTLRILPIHKRAMYVHKDGKRMFVTYWCAVCAIRTYTPGICWCCQDDTALDLREKLDN